MHAGKQGERKSEAEGGAKGGDTARKGKVLTQAFAETRAPGPMQVQRLRYGTLYGFLAPRKPVQVGASKRSYKQARHGGTGQMQYEYV